MRRFLLGVAAAASVIALAPAAIAAGLPPATAGASFQAEVEALASSIVAEIDAALAALPANASDDEVAETVRLAVISAVSASGASEPVVIAALQFIIDSGRYAALPVVVATLQAIVEEVAATGSIVGATGGGVGGVPSTGGVVPAGEFEYQPIN